MRPARTRRTASDGIVLVDGACNLCNGWVRFIVARDRSRAFRFGSLQSEEAAPLLRAAGLGTELTSLVVIEHGSAHVESTAVLKVLRRLPFPWPLLYPFIALPRVFRDGAYRIVAARRYRWFGVNETCSLDAPETLRI